MSEIYNTFLLLKPDELEVEYIIRNIPYNSSGSDEQLRERLIREQKDPSQVPSASHISSSPESELEDIKRTTTGLISGIAELTSCYSVVQHRTLLARNIHWSARAARLKNSYGELVGLKTVVDSLDRQKRNIVKSIKKCISEEESRPKDILPESSNTQKESTVDPQIFDNPSFASINPLTQELIPPRNQTPYNVAHTENCSPNSLTVPNTSIQPNPNIQNFQLSQSLHSVPNIQHPNSGVQQVLSYNYPPPRSPIENNIYHDVFDPHSSYPSNQEIGNRQQFLVPKFHEKYIPKWTIKFDGTNKSHDIQEFIFRLENMANRERYPLNELANIVHRFLDGSAERWYWIFIHNCPNATWPQTKQAFLSQFSNFGTDFEIRRRLENRHQKNGESFNDFLLEVQSLNIKLAVKFTEYELLQILRENMSIYLKEKTLALHFNSTEELRLICQKFERLCVSSYTRTMNGQNRNRVSSLELNQIDYPDYGSLATPQSSSNFCEVQELYPRWNINPHSQNQMIDTQVPVIETGILPCVSAPPVTQMSRLSISEIPDKVESQEYDISALNNLSTKSFYVGSKETNLICWNCRDLGHRYQDCSKDFLEIFCFGCGSRGVRKPNCFTCKKRSMENFKPNVTRSGMMLCSDQVATRPKPVMEDTASNTEPHNRHK